MSKRGYGKKVKRSKNLYKKKKSSFRKVVEMGLTLVLVGALVFVGFTVGKTIFEYEGREPVEPVDIDNPHTDVSETSEASETPDVTGEPEEPSTIPEEIGRSVYAPANVLTSTVNLSAFLEKAKSDGFDAVVIELKDSDGRLLYKSEIEVLADTSIIAGTLTAEQISSLCVNAGLKPIARINTLMDKLAPSIIQNVSYTLGEGGRWLDGSASNPDSRLWANPFLQGTKSYISEITSELYKAGFNDIIYANTVFPRLPAANNQYFPANVTGEDVRFSALAELVMFAVGNSPGANIMLEMSLNDIISGTDTVGSAEILRAANTLEGIKLVVTFTRAESESVATGGAVIVPDDLADLVKTSFTKVENQAGELEIIPCMDGTSLSESDREKIISAFVQMGYESHMVRN
ncbi:MAG: putative glycoside hydrolase [Oscillospiraceae bacterium]|nr:putative glycoside hydrolase [Oscillospiraceae bacterium]